MIRKHEFNSQWWGKPVGIVTDPSFFTAGTVGIHEQLEGFEWVEFKAPLDSNLPLKAMSHAGFFQVDTQLPFSLNLKKVENTPSTEQLLVKFAIECPFTVTGSQLRPFTHERFNYIPGCNEIRINNRYALWANELVEQYPETCMQVLLGDRIQGWFLAHAGRPGRLHLTLAMLSRNATVSGMLLYQRACLEFAEKNYRLGEASFSITNTAVHNMYANLKARFHAPLGNWLWVSGNEGLSNHG